MEKNKIIIFTFHIVRRDQVRTLRGCYGYRGRIRIATAVTPLPYGHTVRRNAKPSHCP